MTGRLDAWSFRFGRAARVIIYPWVGFFAIYQNLRGVPSTAPLQAYLDGAWLAAWAIVVNVSAALALFGAATASRVKTPLAPVLPYLIEAVGTAVMFLLVAAYHLALVKERGLTATPTSQIFAGIVWSFSLLRSVSLSLYVAAALRARHRVAEVLSSAHGEAPQNG